MRKQTIITSFLMLFIISSCSTQTNPTPAPTATSTPTEVPTMTATATATLEPTATSVPLPSRWDDPKLLADLESDFEAKTGMSIEDYQNKAVTEKKVSLGGSESYFSDWLHYVEVGMNGSGLGTGIVETESGVKHLVLYVAWGKGDNVKIRPLDVGFEDKGGFVQTSMDLTGLTTYRAPRAYENPLTFSSLGQMKQYLDEKAVGAKIESYVLIRFKDIASCSLPQDPLNCYVGDVPSTYWQFVGDLCRTPGNYINTESQKPVYKVPGGNNTAAWDYSLDNMIEDGVPEGGLIPTMVGLKTLP